MSSARTLPRLPLRALAAILLFACAEPGGPAGPIPCQTDAVCPVGMVCVGGQCMEPGMTDGGAVLDGGSPDAGLPDAGAPDGGAPDAGDVDAGPDAGQGRAFGERCSSHGDCESQICLETSSRGSLCTRRCNADCPADYVCKAFVLDGNRIVNLCIPFGDVYCRPCAASSDCPQPGDRCTDFGGATYCSRDCSDTAACPSGFECRDVPFEQTAEGGADGGVGPDAGPGPTFRQCVPTSGLCPGCIDRDGDRYGVGADCRGRDCDDEDPTVYQGAPELCDRKDNNCDGVVDETYDLRNDDLNCGACGVACRATSGERCCEGTCVDVASSSLHCGACGQRCDFEGALCCAGVCRATLTDPAHCGGCNAACTNEHGAVACEEAQCRPSCAPEYGDCDGNPRNGCERSLSTVDDCGACGRSCVNAHGATRCVLGRCEPSCLPGYGDCDGNPANGCETDVAFSTAHCGGCNRPCTNEHGSTSCEDGVCRPVCEMPWADCDGNPRNGCETNLDTSDAHCGACGRSCGTANASSSRCVTGTCQITCDPGFFDCNGDPADGCEANLANVTTCNSCVRDADCPPDFFCATLGLCTRKKPRGEACTVGPADAPGHECRSGFCVDGYCCDSACEGLCRSCALAGSQGTCTLVPSGQDPGGECADEGAASCGQDGTCDGAGGCRLYAAGTECAPQTCSDGVQTNRKTCDGFGHCVAPTPATLLCSPYTCSGGACLTSCDPQNPAGQCAPGFTCVLEGTRGVCKGTGGTPCNPDGPHTGCSSGFCKDGVCCNVACDGVCQRCDLPGSTGICANIPAGSDPDGECAAQAASTCGTTGVCSGSGSCALYPSGTVCAPQTCVGGVETSARTCDGAGTCNPATQRSCGAYACNSATQSCFTSCSVDAHCAAGYGCAPDRTCKKLDGQSCGSAAECRSGFCADGVCCNSACTGTCEKCNLAGRVGICDPIAAGQDPDNECSPQAPSTCGRTGVCSGSRTCQLYPTGTVCAAAFCTADGTASNRADTCNGVGTCVDNGVQACGPFTCDASTGLCRTSCSANAHCAAGYGCKVATGECLKLDGQSCASNSDCLNGACCSGICRNLQNDPNNCGACGNVCTNANGTTSCGGGVCNPVCNTGWADCDGNRNNGCETSLRTNANCGSCGTICDLAHASESCSTGTCTLTSCNSGFANCDGNSGNGCELQLNAYSNACGSAEYVGDACGDESCGFVCPGTNWQTRASRTGRGSRWFRFRVNECSACCADIYARITLAVPSDADYDLHTYSACGVPISGGSSTNGTGVTDQVTLYRSDDCGGGDDGFDVWVEVRYYSGSSCGSWTVSFEGRSC